MLKYLIAVDGTAHAHRAIEAVARLAKHLNGLTVVLLNVREDLQHYGELLPADYAEVAGRRQRQVLDEAAAIARGHGLEHVLTESVAGEPAEQIIRAAKAHGVDQIAMGTHGRGAVGGLFIGSIAQRVIHLADIPVLLVK
ncbi:MAG: universal stress protein [Caldimonas sp.]